MIISLEESRSYSEIAAKAPIVWGKWEYYVTL